MVHEEFGYKQRTSLLVTIDGKAFDLPADESATGENLAELLAFLPSLLDRFAPLATR